MSSVSPHSDPNAERWLERLKATAPFEPPVVSEADRRVAEDAALRAWRQADRTPSRRRVWWIGGALAAALAVFVVWFGLAVTRPPMPISAPTASAYVPPFRPFRQVTHYTDARETSTGLVTFLHLVKARDLHDSLPDQPRLLQAGRVWETGAKGFASARLDGRVRLILWPGSRLRFVESEGQVVPQLELGRVMVDVRVSNLKPAFELRVPGARVVDVGTRYDVTVDARRVSVRVDEGLVRIDRRLGGQTEVRGGRAVAWPLDSASLEVRLAPEAKRLYVEGQALTREAPMLHFSARAEEAAEPEAAPAPEAPPVAAPATSWERTLSSLGDLKRASLVKYFSATEQQMRQGYSKRAAQDLERFVASHPAAEAEKAYWYLVLAYRNLGEAENVSRACQAYLSHFPQGTWAAEAANTCRN